MDGDQGFQPLPATPRTVQGCRDPRGDRKFAFSQQLDWSPQKCQKVHYALFHTVLNVVNDYHFRLIFV